MKFYQLLFAILFFAAGLSAQIDSTIIQPVQQQLDAYNNRNLDLFLAQYQDTVKVYRYPNTLLYQGKANMRQRYGGMFKELTDLHCRLVNRIVMKNTIIDHESVTTHKDRPPFQAIAIYKVKGGLIDEVTFIQ